jgi:hypothetical protein
MPQPFARELSFVDGTIPLAAATISAQRAVSKKSVNGIMDDLSKDNFAR